MDFWLRVKDKIRRENTTQEWVANAAGINVSTFRGWITKKVMPNVDQALAIAEALDTSVEYLVKGQALKAGHGDDISELVKLYRSLSPELQAVALAQIRALSGAKAPQSADAFFGAGQKPAAG